MTDTWTLPADTDAGTPTLTEAAADVLDVAAAWAAGELPTGEALRLILTTPRAIGDAFRAITPADPRWSPLARLHKTEYSQRTDSVYTNFGWLDRATFEMVERNNRYRATAGAATWEEDAA